MNEKIAGFLRKPSVTLSSQNVREIISREEHNFCFCNKKTTVKVDILKHHDLRSKFFPLQWQKSWTTFENAQAKFISFIGII